MRAVIQPAAMWTRPLFLALVFAPLTLPAAGLGQSGEPPGRDPRMYDLLEAVSADRIESDIRALVGFGTRHTLSETASETRGIGAARRWVHAEFTLISDACGGCLEVSYQRTVVPGREGSRIPVDTEVV